MNQADSLPDAQEGVPSRTFLARVLGVFIEPGETFEEIARKPDLFSPLVLLALVALSVAETMLARVGMGRIILHTLTQTGQAAKMSSAQLSQAVHQGAALASVLTQISAVLGVPIFLFVVAGFGMVVLKGFFGSEAKFKQVFSVTCYAYMPSIVGAVMAIAVILLGNPASFNPQSPAPTNLGFFLNPATTSQVALALASSLDIIIIWFLILLAIGISRVSGKKVKSSSLFMTYAGAWILLVIVKVGFAMLT